MTQFAMVSINRSFLFGIGFASLTWIISLYLYLQLTKSAENEPHLAISSQLTNLNNETYKFKKTQFNSNDLLEKLMPIDRSDRNSSNGLEQGNLCSFYSGLADLSLFQSCLIWGW